jgi:type IV pilus assembly protein PilV
MIEVLVTMLIISLALLGTSGLQAYSMRLNQGGQFRTQAVFLVADLAERMEANKAGAAPATGAGAYVVGATSTAGALSTACSSNGPCNATALAAFDISVWQNMVAATLPQSSWSVTQTVAGNPSTYQIRINWVDRKENVTYDTAGTAATGEAMSYTATRTIFY